MHAYTVQAKFHIGQRVCWNGDRMHEGVVRSLLYYGDGQTVEYGVSFMSPSNGLLVSMVREFELEPVAEDVAELPGGDPDVEPLPPHLDGVTPDEPPPNARFG